MKQFKFDKYSDRFPYARSRLFFSDFIARQHIIKGMACCATSQLQPKSCTQGRAWPAAGQLAFCTSPHAQQNELQLLSAELLHTKEKKYEGNLPLKIKLTAQ